MDSMIYATREINTRFARPSRTPTISALMSKRGIAARSVVAFLIFAHIALTPMRAGAETGNFAIPEGWFFTETGGGGTLGYAVTDGGGIPFWTFFDETGSIRQHGYPVSQRWTEGVFTYQAFQKSVLQWQPDRGMAYRNIYDRLSSAGSDPWLDTNKNIPAPWDFPQDSGQPFDVVVQNHLALLELNPAIKTRWFENSDWFDAYGLPVAYEDREGVRVLRGQRAVFQQWMIPTSFTSVGGIVISNGGDHFKEAGHVPSGAAAPVDAPLVVGRSTYWTEDVETPVGTFHAKILRIDLANPQLEVMTLHAPAQSGMAVLDFVNAVDGFAGMNGTYFCPPVYAACPNDPPYFTNSRVYDSRTGRFDRDWADPAFNYFLTFDINNVPRLVEFDGYGDEFAGFADRFAQEFGTSLRAAIGSHPRLVRDGMVDVAGRVDARQATAKAPRGGIGVRGMNLYLLQVENATVYDLAQIMVALGLEQGINTDGGGSSAIVSDGSYEVGPGRLVPNAIVFVET